MAPKADFRKTSQQVEREIVELVDRVDRTLESSNGESEKKGHFLFSAITSLLVFAAISVMQTFFSAKSATDQEKTAQPPSPVIGNNEIATIEVSADRILKQISEIKEVKSRVSPSMPIDANLATAENAAQDIRRSIGKASTKSDSGNTE